MATAKGVIAAGLLAGVFASCAAPLPIYLKPITSGSQPERGLSSNSNIDAIVRDGRYYMISRLRQSAVIISGQLTNENLMLSVSIKNLSSDRFVIDPNEISVLAQAVPTTAYVKRAAYSDTQSTFLDRIRRNQKSVEEMTMKPGQLVRFPVYKANKYVQNLQQEHAWGLIAMAISGGIEALDAGTTQKTFSGRISGYVETATFHATSETRDQSKINESQAQSLEKIEARSEEQEEELFTTSRSLLRMNTVFPDEIVSGVVVADRSIRAVHAIEIKVPVAGETHRYSLEPYK